MRINHLVTFTDIASGKGSRTSVFRSSDGVNLETLEIRDATQNFAGINSSGDIAFKGKFSRFFVYTDEHGILAIDDVAVGSADDLAEWSSASSQTVAHDLNDRISTGFGQICGVTGISVGFRAFVLTPVVEVQEDVAQIKKEEAWRGARPR